MTTQRLALPVRVLKHGGPSERLCGSGFLVSVGDSVYLITVAHLPHGGSQQGRRWVVTNKWDTWTQHLLLVLGDGSEAAVPLFRNTAFGTRDPRFGYKLDPQEPERIFDFIWLPITDRKSTRLNSSHVAISYAVFCLKK